MERLSELILLFIAKELRVRGHDRKEKKQNGRNAKDKVQDLPPEQNLRRSIPACGYVVRVRRTRPDLSSESKVCDLHKVRTLGNTLKTDGTGQ